MTKREADTIPELRDKDRTESANGWNVYDPTRELSADDAERMWLKLYAQREREQMEAGIARPMSGWSSDVTFTGTLLNPPRQFARPFPARAFLAFCVAGCFAWVGIVAALRWAMQ